jgi:hypothetical protein
VRVPTIVLQLVAGRRSSFAVAGVVSHMTCEDATQRKSTQKNEVVQLGLIILRSQVRSLPGPPIKVQFKGYFCDASGRVVTEA